MKLLTLEVFLNRKCWLCATDATHSLLMCGFGDPDSKGKEMAGAVAKSFPEPVLLSGFHLYVGGLPDGSG